MALVNEVGGIPMAYDFGLSATAAAPSFGVAGVMDASGEKIAFVGNIWHPTQKTGTIKIRRIMFRCGAITLNAASEVRVSLQDMSPTGGPPYRPDGTQDQFYDFKTATTALSASAWNSTGDLSADRDVNLASDSLGDTNSRRLAVVFEFNAFNASDSVIISDLLSTAFYQTTGVLLQTGGTWAISGQRAPIVVFVCDDGSFAFMQGAAVWTAAGVATIGNAAAIRRAGVKFRFPTERQIDRVGISVQLQAGVDGRIVLYDGDGTTELRSVSLDNNDWRATTSSVYIEVPFEPITLAANTDYRLAWVSGVATTNSMSYLEVNAAGHMDGAIYGQNAVWTQHDGTSWTDIATRRPMFALGVSAYHSPGGGGLLLNSGMTGGMRG